MGGNEKAEIQISQASKVDDTPEGFMDDVLRGRYAAGRERGGTGASASTEKFENLGVIKSIDLPGGLLKSNESQPFLGTLTKFYAPRGTDTEFGFLQHTGRQVDQASADTFHKMLKDHPNLTAPLYIYNEASGPPTQQQRDFMAKLSTVLGATTLGDNQLTSTGSRTPAFHLESARLETINGKTVLAVDGWYRQKDDQGNWKTEPDGTPSKRRYSGIFIDGDGAGKAAQELYLLSGQEAQFNKYNQQYKKSLQSIKW